MRNKTHEVRELDKKQWYMIKSTGVSQPGLMLHSAFGKLSLSAHFPLIHRAVVKI